MPDQFQGILDWLTLLPEATPQDGPPNDASPTATDNGTNPSETASAPEATAPTAQASPSEENGIALNADQIGDVANALWRGVIGLGEWLKSKIENVTSMFGMLAGFALVPVYVFIFSLKKGYPAQLDPLPAGA